MQYTLGSHRCICSLSPPVQALLTCSNGCAGTCGEKHNFLPDPWHSIFYIFFDLWRRSAQTLLTHDRPTFVRGRVLYAAQRFALLASVGQHARAWVSLAHFDLRYLPCPSWWPLFASLVHRPLPPRTAQAMAALIWNPAAVTISLKDSFHITWFFLFAIDDRLKAALPEAVRSTFAPLVTIGMLSNEKLGVYCRRPLHPATPSLDFFDPVPALTPAMPPRRPSSPRAVQRSFTATPRGSTTAPARAAVRACPWLEASRR